MYYRKSGQPAGPAGAQNKRAARDLMSGGTVPGLVGYLGDSPVGCISLGPREEYLKPRRSPACTHDSPRGNAGLRSEPWAGYGWLLRVR
jgi:hypothetical protein